MKIGNLVLGIFCLMLCSCTANCRAKNFGGKMAIDLPCDQKLFDVTWKEDNLWYAMRPMADDEKPETYRFVEESSLGAMEGTVIFHESRCRAEQ
ncbi:MAG: hypothetical protein A2301_01655 [Candidatus Magasanikbacteria bacterium RIFOXYB2_FULL_40_13]|nr:MAG: hypothetical protein A2301_01655 [Candidatus Magasanikbacteria bacterium RIFOXYB2_FULL_40_13]